MTPEQQSELRKLAEACRPFCFPEATPHREFADAATPAVVLELIAEIGQLQTLVSRMESDASDDSKTLRDLRDQNENLRARAAEIAKLAGADGMLWLLSEWRTNQNQNNHAADCRIHDCYADKCTCYLADTDRLLAEVKEGTQ